MAVGVGEIAGATASERRLRAPRDPPTGGLRQASILRQRRAREKRQSEPAELEKYDVALARGRGAKAEAALVEGAGAGEIGDAERDETDTGSNIGADMALIARKWVGRRRRFDHRARSQT